MQFEEAKHLPWGYYNDPETDGWLLVAYDPYREIYIGTIGTVLDDRWLAEHLARLHNAKLSLNGFKKLEWY